MAFEVEFFAGIEQPGNPYGNYWGTENVRHAEEL
jgi:hypothetical protein